MSGRALASVVASRQALAANRRTAQTYDPRTRALLEAPIASTLLRLSAPNVLVMVAQASVGLIETYFVGKLGTDALAGVALVFPVVMLMQMMSAGAMGGGISSAIARALGAGRRQEADALSLHALVIAVMFGLVFTVGALLGGPSVYAAMGGTGRTLDAALIYSDVIFSFAILIWIFNSLANVIRGTGNMAVPATVTCVGTLALVPLSPCLIFGWGPFPQLGVAGGAAAVATFYAVASGALAAYLCLGRSVVRLSLASVGLRWALLWEILRVGLVAALVTFATNLTVIIATGLVGRFGSAAIAGYGTGSRLEYLLVPLVFGLGGPLVAIVGTNIGAGRRERAVRAAWIGSATAAVLCEAIGLSGAFAPRAWLGLFASDPRMLDAGSSYLQTVGPFYGLFGLGLGMYFASQGAGRLLWPLVANGVRLLIAAGGGCLALRWSGNLTHVLAAQGAALAAFGLINAAAVAAGVWFSAPPAPRRTAAAVPRASNWFDALRRRLAERDDDLSRERASRRATVESPLRARPDNGDGDAVASAGRCLMGARRCLAAPAGTTVLASSNG
jgi:putative MATE family efflux protein